METQIDPIFSQTDRANLPQSVTQQPAPKKPSSFFGRKFLIVFLAGITIAVAVVGYVWFRNSRPVNPESKNVEVTIKGPDNLSSGNEVEYIITYSNGENADLIGLSMEVFYPTNFTFRTSTPSSKTSSGQAFELPVLRQGQQGEVIVKGKLTGNIRETKEIKARLHYKLSNFNSIFTVEGSHKTTILQPDLVLEISGPIDVTNGQDSTFTLNYSNVSEQEFDNVVVQAHYPAGFKFTASSPGPSKDNNVWNIGKLVPGARGKVDVSGSFTGDPNQEKLVVSELGMTINNNFAPQITASAAFKIVPSSLKLVQRVTPDTFITLGQSINYNINYGNYDTRGMTNVVITLTLEGAAIDPSQLKVSDAIVTGNTLTWKSATLKNLSLVSPNQEGEINFTIPTKNTLSTNIKNQMIKGTATIYSDQIKSPVRAGDVEIKIASSLGLIASGRYVSGAMPMKVGQSTTYAITFLITNFSNDLENVELIASLPLPDSAWKDVVAPDSERANVVFDRNANKIRWRLGKVPAFVGRFTPARTLTFQLEVVPGFADNGAAISLIKDVEAEGHDTFINLPITSVKINDLRTTDLDDPVVEDSGGTVRP
ncbi:MAG TPA: hypothetical protein VD998_03120 [Verrucomicrobiae bacterium]|nr:hypothetical protein [Verrucomicrobiae bacterium]